MQLWHILTPFLLDINVYLQAYIFSIRDFELKEKFNNVSLFEFYNNYLPRNIYSWLHYTYSLFGNINLYIVNS